MRVKLKFEDFDKMAFNLFPGYFKKTYSAILIKTAYSYNKKQITDWVKEKKTIKYIEIAPLSRKWFRYKAQIARFVGWSERLMIGNDTIRIHSDIDLELMRDMNKVDVTNIPKLECKYIGGVPIYTLTTPDGKVYEAYKHL